MKAANKSRIEGIEGALLTAIQWEGQWFPDRVDLVSGMFEAFLFPFQNDIPRLLQNPKFFVGYDPEVV